VDDAVLEVHVLPQQGSQFSRSHSQHEREYQQCFDAYVRCRAIKADLGSAGPARHEAEIVPEACDGRVSSGPRAAREVSAVRRRMRGGLATFAVGEVTQETHGEMQ
jgi:hypothetical protein